MYRTRLIAALAGLGLAVAVLATAASEPLPRFAIEGSSAIDCEDTPFSRHVTLGTDAEAINLIATSGSFNHIDEYVPADSGPDPLTRTFRDGLYPGALAGSTFLKAITIDLDGDGRDEIVTANRVTATGHLRLGVFRAHTGQGVELIDTWTAAHSLHNFDPVDLAVGDLDGSGDGAQELAVLVRTPAPSSVLHVYVLTGDANGGLAEPDGGFAGYWARSGVDAGSPSLTAGDVLLNGRDQIILGHTTTDDDDALALEYHVLQYLPQQTPALPIAPGDTLIGSKSFTSHLGLEFQTDDPDLSYPIGHVRRLRIDAGDVVGSAAAELVLHIQFVGFSNHVEHLAHRLHHFVATRDGGAITDIELATRGPGREFDSSRLIRNSDFSLPHLFEAAVANIDRVSPAEIVVAYSDPAEGLVVAAYKARPNLAAGYSHDTDGLTVRFSNTSIGTIISHSWDFGDGSTSSHISPAHTYGTSGTRTVSLTVEDTFGDTRTYSTEVEVQPGQEFSVDMQAPDMYWLNVQPSYKATYPVPFMEDMTLVNLAVGDMDKDGIAEIMTLVRLENQHLLRSVWKLSDPSNPDSFAGTHMIETDDAFASITALDLLASDTDGDSVQAVLGTDCRRVHEPQVRQVIWLPPYFQRLQADADMGASFGRTTTSGTSTETSFGTFTSHDVSAYLGGQVGGDVFGIGAQASIKATAGYSYQASRGALFGSENHFSVGEGFLQTRGEALVGFEQNSFDCYSYDILQQSEGIDPDSNARMCEVIDDSRFLSATRADLWDTIIPAAGVNHPPAQWLPLHRDWASLALFRPVTTTTALLPAHDADAVTDGLFGTGAETDGEVAQPYLQIDLGSIRDISNIRVFPNAGQAAKLQGFRVYASASPMTGPGIPDDTGVRVFAPETGDDVAYDRWSIWTRDQIDPSDMLRARYIRLQHPGDAALSVAEIQVFGDVHVEPPFYPEYACDPVPDDGFFNVRVWDPAAGAGGSFRLIDARGDLLWSGLAGIPAGDCSNHGQLPEKPIWQNAAIGHSATNFWHVGEGDNNVIGSNTGFESAIRVGAEFDAEAGFIGKVLVGGAYEFSSGITEDVQTTSFWGIDLEIGGEIEGFDDEFQSLVNTCQYRPRPYAYRLIDVSNTGYEHTAYVVDYVIHQGAGMWQRHDISDLCLDLADDVIFASGFE